MKKFKFLAVVFTTLVMGLGVYSCTKDDINSSKAYATIEMRSENSSYPTVYTGEDKVLRSNVTYIHNGISTKQGEEILETDLTSFVYGLDENFYVFDNDILLAEWASLDESRQVIADLLNTSIELKQLIEQPDGEEIIEALILPSGRLYRDLNRQGESWWIRSSNYRSRRNTASSWATLGGGFVADFTRWGGRKVFFTGVSFGNLNIPFDFEDKAESGWN